MQKMRKKCQFKFYSSSFFCKKIRGFDSIKLILFCVRINVCLFIILCSEVSFQEKRLNLSLLNEYLCNGPLLIHTLVLCVANLTEKYLNIYILRNFVNIDHTIYFFVALCKENISPLKKENLRLGWNGCLKEKKHFMSY